jgi:hypothetical protein
MPNSSLLIQTAWLFLLAIPVACVAWTVTHEEVFKEPREYCIKQSKGCKTFIQRKFFYLFTCEYCFSHYVALFFLIITRYTLLLPGCRGFLIGWFSLVWVANVYINIFALLRMDIKKEKTNITYTEEKIAANTKEKK